MATVAMGLDQFQRLLSCGLGMRLYTYDLDVKLHTQVTGESRPFGLPGGSKA